MQPKAKITNLTRTDKGVKITIISLTEPILLSPSTVVHSKLEQGITLTESQVEFLVRESKIYECDQTVLRMLSRRAYSIGELKVRLKKRGHELEIVDEVIKKKKKQGVLDDAKYGYSIARRLLEQTPCGKSYVRAHLLKKRIPTELAEEIANAAFTQQDDMELALKALRKRWWRFADLELETARTKAYTYLSRRGFGYRTSRAAFEQVFSEEKKEESH